jgi:hypothetical protein
MTSDKNDAGPGGGSSSARWWEYYLVRYFVGSVVGAAVVLVMAIRLSEQSSGMLNDFIVTLLAALKDGSAKSFFVIGAAGVTYCYIASAPMMILHASRAQLIDNKSQTFNRSFYLLATVTLIVLAAIGVIVAGGANSFEISLRLP